MNFRDALIRINADFWSAREEEFGGHEVARFIRKDVPAILERKLSLTKTEMIAEASPGKGNWSSSPWIRLTDPSVSDSAERGYYPVYLYGLDKQSLVLTLLQGTYSVRKEFGRGRRKILRSRATILAGKVPEHVHRFTSGEIDLGIDEQVPDRGDWQVASAFSKRYDLRDLPSEDVLLDDLKAMLDLYRKAIFRGGWEDLGESTSADASDGGDQSDLDGRRQYRRHRTLERNRKLAQKAKEIHGSTCKACGITMEHIYGEAGRGYIEAHHLVPLAKVATEGGIRRDPATDFTVLCPNCHRIIHKLGAPPLAEFKGKVLCKAVESCMGTGAHS